MQGMFTKEFSTYLRKKDIFARVGGDEFAVLLPECPLESAAKRMEAIRGHMSDQCSSSFSFSFGITFVPKDSSDSENAIFHRADREMYRDKQARTKIEGGR